ncbi:Calmodulin-binding protein 60 E [Vitis vinifera]|uniref:Calmodulin-binding protein 60 E n=1 Tax=Vitis vinifera TaxID=29760 RepID=A0A438ILK6_VITVI|nr:Calmodulin-binding protein 60 E [Vitis vinifera]
MESSPPRIQAPGGKNLQLHFKTRMPPHLFTGGKVTFNEESDDDWTKEHFESHEVKEREGKRPLLTGIYRKFRLGVKIAPGYCEDVHIREAKTEAFAVKDHRGE